MPGSIDPSEYGMSSKSNGFLIHSNKGRDERTLLLNGGVRLEELVTLTVIKGSSTSGPIKKMLHVPTLTIMTLKEIPIQSREIRGVLKEWINQWEASNNHLEGALHIYGNFWNQPEGCVSLLSSFCNGFCLQTLLDTSGCIPEKILQDVALQTLTSLDQMHSTN